MVLCKDNLELCILTIILSFLIVLSILIFIFIRLRKIKRESQPLILVKVRPINVTKLL